MSVAKEYRGVALTCAAAVSLASTAVAQQSDWIVNTGNFCTPSNWSPAGVPDINRDAFIGRTTATPNVTLNCDVLLRSLTMQGASAFSTNGRQISAINDIVVSESGGNSSLLLTPHASGPSTFALGAANVVMNTGTAMTLLNGARVHVGNRLRVGSSARVSGEGTLRFFAGAAATSLVNEGELAASGGTLTIESARPLDLDGTSGAGVLRVLTPDSQMIIMAPLAAGDAFDGLIDIAPGNWIQFHHPFAANGDVSLRGQGTQHAELIAPTLTFGNGSFLTVTSGLAHLQADNVTWNQGAIIDIPSAGHLLVNADDLDFHAGIDAQIDGRMTVTGFSRLHGATLFGAQLISLDEIHVIEGVNVIDMDTGEFNWDGVDGNAQTIVNAGASLALNVPVINYSNGAGDNSFDGMVINRGNLAVNTLGRWDLTGVMQLQRLSTSQPLPMLSGADIELSGRIEGTGMIESVDVTAIGVIAPGAAPTTGRLHFSRGSLTLGQANVIEIDIGGATQATQYDHVLAWNSGNTSQTMNLAGTLRVRLANGFTPAVGQAFNIIEGHTLSGVFHAVDAPGFEVTYVRVAGATLDRVVATYVGLPETCPADIAPPDGDNVVAIDDLLAVIAAWGPCLGACPADIAPPDGDGLVNIDDLLAVVGAWGSCPP